MKKFILRGKWLGFFVVLFVSLGVGLDFAGKISELYIQAEPLVAQEADYFLPIRFSGGEIVSPENVNIERTYGTATEPYKVVLNTKVEDLNISDLSTGIYITRNKIYSYNSQKGETKIQSLAKIPDGEITKADLQEYSAKFGAYLKPILTIIITVALMIYFGLISLFYTLIMHWLFKKLYNADFALTLRVNVLMCVALFALGSLVGTDFGFIITLLLLGACNYIANILLNEREKA